MPSYNPHGLFLYTYVYLCIYYSLDLIRVNTLFVSPIAQHKSNMNKSLMRAVRWFYFDDPDTMSIDQYPTRCSTTIHIMFTHN